MFICRGNKLLCDDLTFKINTLRGLLQGIEELSFGQFNDFFYSGKEYYFVAYDNNMPS